MDKPDLKFERLGTATFDADLFALELEEFGSPFRSYDLTKDVNAEPEPELTTGFTYNDIDAHRVRIATVHSLRRNYEPTDVKYSCELDVWRPKQPVMSQHMSARLTVYEITEMGRQTMTVACLVARFDQAVCADPLDHILTLDKLREAVLVNDTIDDDVLCLLAVDLDRFKNLLRSSSS